MQIRVLGCSGSIADGCRTTSFLLDGEVLIDAGTGVGDLTMDEMARIEHIVISHSHLDHVLSIGLLADTVLRRRRGKPPIQVHALEATMAALRAHIFNGVIWPDFSRIPSVTEPVLEFHTFTVGDIVDAGRGRRIEVLPAQHTVPAVGFAVHAKEGAWVFTGDTGPNDELWAWAATTRIAHLVIETAFSDDEEVIARLSQHLCPSMLATELAKAPNQSLDRAQIHITHIKPGEVDAVMRQIHAIKGSYSVRALDTGDVMTFE
jgi:ribonuclease BN (tRNA processing enzyme)